MQIEPDVLDQKEPKRIIQLDSKVIDQIAAGEVVERPAHLVKELIENSFDAMASDVVVEVSNGGRTIRVVDNGSGIYPEDLKKALDRHATSKISTSEDLFKLHTFGFRGEALASIAAVSRLTLSSRVSELEAGRKITSEFGTVSDVEVLSHAVGTQIIIEDLFSNVPARLKFLKSSAAEISQIKNVIKAMALAHPNADIKLKVEGELVFAFTATTSFLKRAEQVLDMENLYENSISREGFDVRAIFTDPHQTMKTSRQIWIFVQNRWVQDRSLQAAVIDAYQSLLMHGEYPAACIWVDLAPENVDVNIHPTKSQVKFADPSMAFRAVRQALRQKLETAPWIKNEPQFVFKNDVFKNYSAAEFVESSPQKIETSFPHNLSFTDAVIEKTQFRAKSNFENLSAFVPVEETVATKSTNEVVGYWSQHQVIGQANNTYIICQTREGLVLVDQHAAHERVNYEKLHNLWLGGKIDVQNYLFPLSLDFSAEKIEALISQQNSFAKLGIEFEQLGPESLGVKSAPSIIKEEAIAKVLEQVADEIIKNGGSFLFEKLIVDICATMACHSSVRAGNVLSIDEMRALLKNMDEFPLSSFCPHGRPVSVKISFNKLEKDFGRTV
jgi:DNA mismatch repair protein MutL